MLRRDIVDGRSSGHRRHVRGSLRRVAADVGARWVLDALLALRILRHTGDGPVLFFGYSVDDQSWKRVWSRSFHVSCLPLVPGAWENHTVCLGSRCKQQPREEVHLGFQQGFTERSVTPLSMYSSLKRTMLEFFVLLCLGSSWSQPLPARAGISSQVNQHTEKFIGDRGSGMPLALQYHPFGLLSLQRDSRGSCGMGQDPNATAESRGIQIWMLGSRMT